MQYVSLLDAHVSLCGYLKPESALTVPLEPPSLLKNLREGDDRLEVATQRPLLRPYPLARAKINTGIVYNLLGIYSYNLFRTTAQLSLSLPSTSHSISLGHTQYGPLI